MGEYYLIGSYMSIPIYCNKEYDLVLGSRFIDFKKISKVRQDVIIASLGGIEGIEKIISKYERSKTNDWRQKKNVRNRM